MNYYRSTTICKVHDDFKHASISVDCKDQPTLGQPRSQNKLYKLVEIEVP